MKIQNPVIRAGSVVPADVVQPFYRFDLANSETSQVFNGSFSDFTTVDLTDTPGFGPSYPGMYLMEYMFCITGGALDCTFTSRIAKVTGGSTGYQTYQQWLVPAGQVVYQHQQLSIQQATAVLYDISLQLKCNQTDAELQGKATAVTDWCWILITKQASNSS